MAYKPKEREDWSELRDRIERSFFGDHGRPKKHIHLCRDSWEKIKSHADTSAQVIDEAAIARLLTEID